METNSDHLIDGFGRVIDDLRVSVTDRCNFRCVYCMPAEGMQWLAPERLLTFEEITKVVSVFLSLGVKTVRLTGGEPTLRRGLASLVAMLRALSSELDIAMTTNGFLLEQMAAELKEAGLDRVNVSVDSLMQHRFAEITRRDALHKVTAGIAAAERAGLGPIKLNCVVVKGRNDDEILDFARLARQSGYGVRFIEYMPLDAEMKWSRDDVVPMEQIISRIQEVFPLIPIDSGPAPARTFAFADGAPGTVGVIPSVSQPFCASCNRVRVTADGQLRTCLFSIDETDLRKTLREGGSADDIVRSIKRAVSEKQEGHKINRVDFQRPERSMSMIGG